MRKSDVDLDANGKDNRKLSDFHKPVLEKEVIEFLRVEKGKKYIDATLGGGGYTFEILKKGGIVLGIDLDQDAIEFVKLKVKSSKLRVKLGEELILVQGNFRDIKKIAHLNKFDKVLGIVFDLGLSSYQIEKSGRGFSFKRDEPLDMRMGYSQDSNRLTAADIVNTWTKEELYELFSKMGEERFSGPISNNIVSARKIGPIKSSLQLVKIIADCVPEKRKTHPATKVFQALRIAVNSELTNLKAGILDGFELLENGGIMAVVSFHSLEDRITKNSFRDFERSKKGKVITRKPVTAADYELNANIRARSAKLRVIEKIAI